MPSPRTARALARLADLTPTRIVAELDRYIIGQASAKKAVAIALRNRWRRQHTDESIRAEISPNNIILIGPTGCGKTEISAAHPMLHSPSTTPVYRVCTPRWSGAANIS